MTTRKPDPKHRVAWVNERNDERGDMRVLQGFATLRAERVYDEAVRCDACEQARAVDGEDALCEDHLAQALGMHSDWDAPR